LIDLAQVAGFERWAREVRGIAQRLDQDGGYDPATDPANNHLHLVPTTDGITYVSGQLVGELALTIKQADRRRNRSRAEALPRRRRSHRRRHTGPQPSDKHAPKRSANSSIEAPGYPTAKANSPNPKSL
jgi:hypothetical protein